MTSDEVVEYCKNYWINNKVIPYPWTYGVVQTASGRWKRWGNSCCVIGAILLDKQTWVKGEFISAAAEIMNTSLDEMISLEAGFKDGYDKTSVGYQDLCPDICIDTHLKWYDVGHHLGNWAFIYVSDLDSSLTEAAGVTPPDEVVGKN